ncbi:type II toxin-antitoxin system HipA family toxin [Acinetobacter sp. NIPH 2377]|jgi:serine/threonine-protein kinase HipA|uniref:type II toxin-antitoxin system HipA family toxin n=1 Tax=Acinetobacter terrestris TaxID=2529843 RepID=UPI00149072CB|nr:HipA domain-containing protein [Acinetobacter terrestris]NNH36461.1 type II toxin-antitoxin system HipA family toxin [Acinetobacter terrestris]
MNEFCTIQIFKNQQWIDCALVELLDVTTLGWEAPTRTSYLFEYAISSMDARDIHALSFNLPVNVQSVQTPTWPAFLIDLLPQGYGRKELLKELNFSENAQQHADWALLKAGAGNPIGHLRIKEAHEWLYTKFPVTPTQGFSLEEIIQRRETFIESLASYGLFVAGSSGIQGEWPKLLLTQAQDGLFYLDHTLPDDQAMKHWLVKFSRGSDQRLEKILSQEALYMQVAQHLGLRVYQDIELHERTLFIPRFDRRIKEGQVERIAQESIASLSNRAGFGVKLTHNEICQLLASSCTHPETEIIEYLKRDLANVALGNKDNHTRNTAIQRTEHGLVQLTPVFDFAPMWLHPDGIARTTRWQRDDQGGSPLWVSVIEQIAELSSVSTETLRQVLKQQLPIYESLLSYMYAIHMDPEIIENSTVRIRNICQQLNEL